MNEEEARKKLKELEEKYIENSSKQLFVVDGTEKNWFDMQWEKMMKQIGGIAGLTPEMFLDALEEELIVESMDRLIKDTDFKY